MSVGSGIQTGSAASNELYYRPVSKAAALEVVLAVVSFLAFAFPVAWILPIVCLFVSLRTSNWLERARQEYAGQLLAKLAIFISLIVGVCAPTKHFVERHLIVEEAVSSCNTFLDLVLANQVKEAYPYTLSPVKKIGMENKIEELIVRAGQEYREYLNTDVVIKLRGRMQVAQVSYLGLATRADKPGHNATLWEKTQDWIEGTNYLYSNGAYQVALRYRVALDDGAVFEVVTIMVGGTGDWKGRQWFVGKIDLKTVY